MSTDSLLGVADATPAIPARHRTIQPSAVRP